MLVSKYFMWEGVDENVHIKDQEVSCLDVSNAFREVIYQEWAIDTTLNVNYTLIIVWKKHLNMSKRYLSGLKL